MPTHNTLPSLFSDIADAIRAKTGDSAQIVADDFPTAIAGISAGSTFATPVTATRTNATTISFSNLEGEPKFFVMTAPNFTNSSSAGSYMVALVVYNGTTVYGGTIYYRSDVGNWQLLTTYTKSWNNNTKTLTITTPYSRNFVASTTYTLLYAY